MSITLTDEQEVVVSRVMDLCNRGNGLLVLNAPAGTGKTFLINYIYDMLTNSYETKDRVLVLAPTNKAVSLFKKKRAMTLHRFFKAEGDIEEETGEIKFILNDANISKLTLLIVDECSMVDAKMCKALDELANQIPVFACGDEAQIPPVKETMSKMFQNSNKVSLTINMRSRDSVSNIYVQKFRAAIDKKEKIRVDKIPCKEREKLLFGEFKRKYLQIKQNPNNDELEVPVVLAWTNKRADEYNHKIRNYIFSKSATDELEKLYNDEQLIFSGFRKYVPFKKESQDDDETSDDNEPLDNLISEIVAQFRFKPKVYNAEEFSNIIDFVEKKSSCKEDIRYYSSDLVVVNNLSSVQFKIPFVKCEHVNDSGKTRKCDKCDIAGHNCSYIPVNFFVFNDQYGVCWLYPKTDVDADNIKKTMSHFKTHCLKMKDKDLWSIYYKCYGTIFPSLNYIYSMTVHKAQGSQWKNVFVDIDNIRFCRDPDISCRLAYTAVSRMRETLQFI
jgi:hypothetical protein